MTGLLKVENLSRSFGGLVVASNISLVLGRGDRVGLIGPNGAGKTTFVNLVSGQIAPSAGRIRLAGVDVTRMSSVQRVRLGLVRTFQVSRVFRDMTVRDHVALAILQREGMGGRLLADPWAIKPVAEEVPALLDDLGLAPVASERVGEIAYGQQRLLELAIALALKPKVLLLDEPAAGVPQGESFRIVRALERLPADIAVLMIEHDIDLVFRFVRSVVVLAGGRIICEGTPADVGVDPRVREVYLGSFAHAQRTF
jgi:branched-chain amino acid transport system ATP-binding protein